MRSLNILSLDLDWFNGHIRRKDKVAEFFATLSSVCHLPHTITVINEHQYLYPWALRLLSEYNAHKVNVINIDEHHDFYYMSTITDFDSGQVGCGNFFAFMAYERILGTYQWVTNVTGGAVIREKNAFLKELESSKSIRVRHVKNHLSVYSRKRIWSIVKRRRFDGFVIVKSFEYTQYKTRMYNWLNQILKEYVKGGGAVIFHSNTAEFKFPRRKNIKLNRPSLI